MLNVPQFNATEPKLSSKVRSFLKCSHVLSNVAHSVHKKGREMSAGWRVFEVRQTVNYDLSKYQEEEKASLYNTSDLLIETFGPAELA